MHVDDAAKVTGAVRDSLLHGLLHSSPVWHLPRQLHSRPHHSLTFVSPGLLTATARPCFVAASFWCFNVTMMVKTSVSWHGCTCTGFKVEPQDRMEKVYSEIDTLWQVSSHTYCLHFVLLPHPQGLCSTIVFQTSANLPRCSFLEGTNWFGQTRLVLHMPTWS